MKQLAIVLVLALLMCTCGCQPASLSGGGASTEPSASDPIETVTAPAISDSILTEIEYTYKSIGAHTLGNPDVGKPEVFLVNSEKDELWVDGYAQNVDSYSETFFEEHSIILFCAVQQYVVYQHRVVSVSKTENGEYLVSIERCTPADVEWPTKYGGCVSYSIVVNCVLPDDAVIHIEEVPVTLPVEEFDAFFGTVNGDYVAGNDC